VGRHPGPLATEVQLEFALVVVGTEGGQAQLGDKLCHARVALSEPLPAELEWRTTFEQHPLGATADTVAGLEHDDVGARLSQRAGGGEAGQPRADDHDVHAHSVSANVGR
jgi:hypothetical protein